MEIKINNFEDYYNEIVKWTTDRYLNKLEYNPSDLMQNIIEELNEAADALDEQDLFGFIDAVADELIYISVDSLKKNSKITIRILEAKWNMFCTMCSELDIDPHIAITEVLKEISSRQGEYDKKKGKWVKDESKKHLLYKADFNKALIMPTS